MSIITDLHRLENEDMMTWQIRCCLAKRRKETDMDWIEIRDMPGLDITPDQLRKQAVGYEEYDNYIHGFNSVATCTLSISDLHVPFQLDYTLLEKYRNVNILQINGDVVDCQTLSKFPKQYRISPISEMIQGRQYLIDLIKYINPKKVICNYGNHDIRFANYFAKNLDTDIFQLQPNTSLELIFEDGFKNYDKINRTKTHYSPLTDVFEDSGIDIVFVDDWKVKIGETWFVHLLANRSGILATADKAKDYSQDTDKDSFDAVVMAHTHSVGDSEKGYVRLIEQGAFCDVNKMRYSDGRLQKPQKWDLLLYARTRMGI